MGLNGKRKPKKHRHQNQWRSHAPKQPGRSHLCQDCAIHRKDEKVIQAQLKQIPSADTTALPQPKEPLMRHGQGAQNELNQVARLHEMIRVLAGDVCVAMMQVMRLSEVRVRNHGWEQCKRSPSEIHSPGAPQMTVNSLVSHNGADEHEVRSQQCVECVLQEITGPQK